MRIERDQINTLIILAGLIAVAALALWLPTQMKKTKLREQIEQVSQELGIHRAGATGLAKVASRVTRLEQVVNQSKKFVPESPLIAALLSDLSAHIAALELVEPSIEQGDSIPGPDYHILPVIVRFRGPFPAVFEMLRQIEDMRRLVRINHVIMSAGKSEAFEPPPVDVEILLDAFSSRSEDART